MNLPHLSCTLKTLILTKMASEHSQLSFTVKLWTTTFDETIWDDHPNCWTYFIQLSLTALFCACVFIGHQSLWYCGLAEHQRQGVFETGISIKMESCFVCPPSWLSDCLSCNTYALPPGLQLHSRFFFARLFGFPGILPFSVIYIYTNASIKTLFSNLNIPLGCMRTFIPNFSFQ